MPKAIRHSYQHEISDQRDAWNRKPVIRTLYRHWYGRCLRSCARIEPSIEIGAGSGNFKESCPQLISSDLFPSGPWVDLVMNAEDLALRPSSLGNVIAFDVIHHLQRPMRFLRDAVTALKPGGRLIVCEPAVSPWSRFVYSFHHEPIDLAWDAFREGPDDPDPGHTFANMGIPQLLFFRHRGRTLSKLKDLRLVSAEQFGFLLYPLTGGFNYRSYLPITGFATLLKIEDILMRPLSALTGVRMLVVFEKSTNTQAQ